MKSHGKAKWVKEIAKPIASIGSEMGMREFREKKSFIVSAR